MFPIGVQCKVSPCLGFESNKTMAFRRIIPFFVSYHHYWFQSKAIFIKIFFYILFGSLPGQAPNKNESKKWEDEKINKKA